MYILPTISVPITKGKETYIARLLVDTGSQRTYVSGRVLQKIRFPSDRIKVPYTVKTFLDSGVREFSEVSLLLDLQGNNLQVPVLIDEDLDMSFSIPSYHLALQNIRREYDLGDNGLVNLTADDLTVDIDGILGVDLIPYLPTFSIQTCLKGSAIVVGSKVLPFGNVENFLSRKDAVEMHQRMRNDITEHNACVNFVLEPCPKYQDPISEVLTDSNVEGNIEKLFRLETIGILEEEKFSSSNLTKVSDFADSIEFINNHYHVKLPWNNKIQNVPSNFHIAHSVLQRVITRLNAKDLFSDYDAIFLEQLEEGVLEEVSLDKISGEEIFIPHREVVRTDETCTQKIRPVLNCSLKVGNSPSLNEASFPGVDLMSNLFELLVGLRHDKYLMTSDVRRAFLQIKIKDDYDRNKFCILWVRDGKLVAYRYTSIVYGYVASPFVLNYVIKHHASKYPDDQCSYFLKNCLYVDNLFINGNDSKQMLELYKTSYNRMLDGGFLLRSWSSNSDILTDAFESDGVAITHGKSTQKVLGYEYDLKTDSLNVAFDGNAVSNSTVITKRSVLSVMAKCFDPLGLVNPIVVKCKTLMRQIWKANLVWDENLPNDLTTRWNSLLVELNQLKRFNFNRQALVSHCDVELFLFTDASNSNYGFNIYTVACKEGSKFSNLLFSKTKVAPLKSRSLPTLELLAIYLAKKCLLGLVKALGRVNITNVVIAVDSQIALSWVLNGNLKSKNVFASNRIADILCYQETLLKEHNIKCEFRYVPTALNPADLLTRGISIREFESKFSFWTTGPSFIREGLNNWPSSQLLSLSDANKTLVGSTFVSQSVAKIPIINLAEFSCLHKLLSVTARLYECGSLLRKKVMTRFDSLALARKYWLISEQANYFSVELEFLKAEDNSIPIPPLVRDLNLFLDPEGILRSRGRLSKCSHLSYEVMNPILIAGNSSFTDLIIEDTHKRCQHLGVSSTLNALRNSGFWLPRPRPQIKKVLKACMPCIKMNALPYRYPKPTDFVGDKVNFIRSFENTGVDFTGHFFVKLSNSFVKLYLIIFTCLSIRAVHLEIVPDMTTKSSLSAFVRFSNRFGFPKCLYSDNAPSFIQAAKILNESSSNDGLSDYLVNNNIKHIRVPLYSPWAASSWERLIRVVKSCLHKSIGRSKIEYFSFLTIISDVQEEINSRPLTYRDTNDPLQEIITPNSFLKIGISRNLTFGAKASEDLVVPSRSDLINTLEVREETLDRFRNLWYEEYLLSLRENHRKLYQPLWEDRVKEGDIVLISSENKPRPMWCMGRIVKLFTGSDGKTRSAEVLRPDRTCGTYSICLLYPLEISSLPVAPYRSIDSVPVSPGAGAAAAAGGGERVRRMAAQQCLRKMRAVD